MVHGDAAGVSGFLLWMLLRQPPLLAQCLDLDMHLYYKAIQNLAYRYENVPQTTAESSSTPLTNCVPTTPVK